jgi:hypothetical protein
MRGRGVSVGEGEGRGVNVGREVKVGRGGRVRGGGVSDGRGAGEAGRLGEGAGREVAWGSQAASKPTTSRAERFKRRRKSRYPQRASFKDLSTTELRQRVLPRCPLGTNQDIRGIVPWRLRGERVMRQGERG